MNHVAHWRRHGCRIAGRAGNERHPRFRILAERQIQESRRRLRHCQVLAGRCHTNDLDPGSFLIVEPDSLPDRALTQISLRESLVNDGNRG